MIQRVYRCEVCEPIPEDDMIHVIFSDKNDSAIGFDWSWWTMEYKGPSWIPCSERLPEEGKYILVKLEYDEDRLRELCQLAADRMKEQFENNYQLICAEIREIRDSHDKDGYHDEADALTLALKIIDKHKFSKNNGWVPMKERIPKAGKDILVCDIDGDIYYTHRSIVGGKSFYWDVGGDQIKNIVAWMPMPAPYQIESEEE